MPLLAGISARPIRLLVLSNADWYPPIYEVSIPEARRGSCLRVPGQDAAFAPDGRVVFAKGKSIFIAAKKMVPISRAFRSFRILFIIPPSRRTDRKFV